MRGIVSALCAVAMLALWGCGGGGGTSGGTQPGPNTGGRGSGPAPASWLALQHENIAAAVGDYAPTQTEHEIQAKGEAVLKAADNLDMTSWYIRTSLPDNLSEIEVNAGCFYSDKVCHPSVTVPVEYQGQTRSVTRSLGSVDLDKLEFDYSGAQAILTRHAVTTILQQSESRRTYGAWMDHSGFAVQSETATVNIEGISEPVNFAARFGMSGGDLSNCKQYLGSGPINWGLREYGWRDSTSRSYRRT